MLAKRIIPCLDLRDGRVVKGVNFVGLRDAGDPVELAQRYNEQSADEIVFLDITASSDARQTLIDVVARAAREVFVPLTVGGGVRSIDDARAVLLAGADKVSVNTAAVRRPELVSELSETFGAQAVVLAIDARSAGAGRWNVFTKGGRVDEGLDAVDWARRGEQLGAGEILLTSMDTDGVQTGLQLRADPRGRARGQHPGDRFRRGGPAGGFRARFRGRRSGRRARRLDLPLRHLHGERSQETPRRRRHSRPPNDTMIIPCIDLMDGAVVQLIQGREKALEGEAPEVMLAKFADFPVIQVIDLDAALGRGSNEAIVERLAAKHRVWVGGGVRSVAKAEQLRAAGAERVIVGTAAFRGDGLNHEFLQELADKLGRAAIILALDSRDGRIVIKGWQESLGIAAGEIIRQLEPYCGAVLCTYVDKEGMMQGTDLEWFRSLRAQTSLELTAAGGITTYEEIEALLAMDIHAALGMAIYTGRLDLARLANFPS